MTNLSDLSDALADAVARAAPAIVTLVDARGRTAVGFHWRAGWVVAAEEATDAFEGDITLRDPDGATHAATAAGRDPSTDVALYRAADLAAPVLPLDAPVPRTGALVLAVGRRGGLPAAALGLVESVGGAWRSLRGGRIDHSIRLGLRLPQGGEGAPLIDASGRGIGMAVTGPRRSVLGIPASTIERVADELARKGHIGRAYLGLRLQPVAVDGGGRGAIIVAVDPDGPGAAAGLLQGDVVTGWDGGSVPKLREIIDDLGADRVGQPIALAVRRGGRSLDLTLTIGERSPAA